MTNETSQIPNLERRLARSLDIRDGRRSVKLPELDGWNHEFPLRPFQEVGVGWLYNIKRGILADPVGLGKTAMSLGLLSLLKTKEQPYRTIVVALNYKAQSQWASEIKRFTDFTVASVHGAKSDRVSQMANSGWDILLTRYSLLLRDFEYMQRLEYDHIICDETSFIQHHSNRTAHHVKALTRQADRVVLLDATPIQTSLLDMHSLMESFHMNIFGAAPAFDNRYIRREPVKFKHGNRYIRTSKVVGYKNMKEFKERIAPFVLRRKVSEVEVDLPAVNTQDIWFELPPKQRKLYDNARQGIIQVHQSDEDGRSRSRKIRAGFHHLQYACDSTYAFDKSNPTSVKLDWLMRELKHDMRGQKVIVFARYLSTVEHIRLELANNNIGHRKFIGKPNMTEEQQDEAIKAFWEDDSVQVLVGTSAFERSLNLQKSAYMVAFNQIWNPMRMQQLLGRIRRIGSEHQTVFMINLLAENTIEERLIRLSQERAAVPDYVFDEQNDIFESLSDDRLMALIQDE